LGKTNVFNIKEQNVPLWMDKMYGKPQRQNHTRLEKSFMIKTRTFANIYGKPNAWEKPLFDLENSAMRKTRTRGKEPLQGRNHFSQDGRNPMCRERPPLHGKPHVWEKPCVHGKPIKGQNQCIYLWEENLSEERTQNVQCMQHLFTSDDTSDTKWKNLYI
jgi:hypothetical protein